MTDELLLYHKYLLHRSLAGKIYRKFLLYPKLVKFLEGKVLDVGCGIGDFCLFRPNTVGVDINPHNIDYCKHLNLDCSLIKPNVAMPFQDSSFRGVVLDNVLEHIQDPDFLLKDINRLLKDKGTFLVGVPGEKGYYSDLDHKVFYTEGLLVSTVEKYGFKLEKIIRTPLPIRALDKTLRQYCIYGVFKKV